MDDLFQSPVLRVEQPRKILAKQARYDIFDDQGGGALLGYAEETDVRSRSQVLKASLPISPPPGAQVLVVHSPGGDPVYVLQKHAGDRLTEIQRADGTPLGRIRAQRTTRHYALVDADDQVVGEITGDLSLRNFTISDAKGLRLGKITKKWAGIARELLTTADRYVVDIAPTAPQTIRTLATMATIMLDLTLHENIHGR